MAFKNGIGNLLKQTISKHLKTELSVSNPAVFQAIRCMSSSKLFIGGLSYSTDDMSLREAFSSHGDVVEARVILDRETGRSRGFGFVTFTSSEEASVAISAMDGKELHGRFLRVNYATERARGFRGDGGYGGGGYGGGGFGGSGGYGGGSYDSGSAGGGYGRGGGYGGDSSGGSYGGGDGSYGSGGGANTYGVGSSNDVGYGAASNGGSTAGGGGGSTGWGLASGSDGFGSGPKDAVGGSYNANDSLDDSKQSDADEMLGDATEKNFGDEDQDDYSNKRL